jgi:hypothetical protein
LILVAFFLPLAVYLLVLGFINRRPRPLLVSGTWDLIGLLAASSGFLLFGGPAILSGLNERWRLFWLFGQGGLGVGGGSGWRLWVFLSALYFALVVGGAASLFWRRRHRTCVYNVDPPTLVRTLAEVCDDFGLEPVRSGNLFLFGMDSVILPGRRPARPEGIQAPHYRPTPGRPAGRLPEPAAGSVAGQEQAPAGELLGHTAILEVDSFPALRHVTLRWDPPSSPLRQEVEAELGRRLESTPAPEHQTGAWLTLIGLTLLAASLLGALFLLLRAMLVR